MKKYLHYIVLTMLCPVFKAAAQPRTPTPALYGKVTDTKGQAIPGANIRLAGTTLVVTSDKNGLFIIGNAPANPTLTINFVGFETATITVKPPFPSLLTITLQEGKALSEILVSSGYQQIPKERATGSFAQVDNELLNRRISGDVISRLEGIVPGLLFNHNTFSSSGGSPDLSIRGTSTLYGQNQPLIVVDGFPYDGDINNLNPNNIENVSVLKDAAAASIWGVKSGNGVIVITTKHGTRNEAVQIGFNSNVTIGDKPDLYYNPNYLNANDFINEEQVLFQKGVFDSDLSNAYTTVSPVVAILARQRAGQLSPASATAQIDALRNNDIRNDLSKYLYQKSINQQYALSLKGGGPSNDYFFSAGYDHNLSNQAGNGNQRITLGTLYNFYPSKKLALTAEINYTQTNSTNNSPLPNMNGGSGKGGIYPYAQLADSRGNALPIVRDYASAYTDTAGKGRFYDWKFRPLDELHNADNTAKLIDNRINLGLKYSLNKALSAEVKYLYEQQSVTSANYFSDQTYYTRNLINQFTQGYPAASLSYPIPKSGILQQSASGVTSHRGRVQLNYSQAIGAGGDLNAIAGAEINQTVTQGNAGTAYGYNKATLTTQNVNFNTYYQINPNQSYALIPNTLGFNQFTDRYLSYYGNAAYSLLKRYTVSLSGRIDKSNLFGVNTNQKAVPLYSAGLAWDFSKEAFFKFKALPYGKLRLTYGYNGNIDKNVTAVTTIQQLTGAANPYSGIPYAIIANPGNPELRWEKSRIINLGLDFGLKNNTLSGSLEYYVKKGTDLFGDSPLAPSTGLSTFRGNTADISGNGLDITLNSRNIQSASFGWETNLLLSYAMDKVTRYAVKSTVSTYFGLGSGSSGTIYPLEGKPLYAIYSYPWAGLSPVNGDPQGYLNGKVSTDYAKIISATTADNMQYSGPARPSTFGSFRNTWTYQSLSLSANLVYKFNYYFRRSSISSSGIIQSWTGNSDYSKRWQKPGDELSTNVPSLQYPPVDNGRETFYQYADVLVEKGDHIRFQDITLSYQIGQSHLKRTAFKSFRLYAYINNVGILWRANKQGIDPDVYAQGYSTALPLPRTYALGLQATF